MIELRFGAVGAHHVRLAISPAAEVLEAVRAARSPGPHPIHLPWARSAGRALAGLGVAELVATLTGGGYYPDFLSPPPDRPRTTFAEQMARVRDTSDEQVATELALTFADRPVPAPLREPGRARDLLAGQMRVCWDELLVPLWPRLLDVLAADVDYRARRYADAGVAGVLTDLHERARHSRDAVLVASDDRVSVELDERGLLLTPTALGWPRLGVMLVPPWQPALVYPARGAATLWHTGTSEGGALAGVLGRGKARLLVALTEPATTTALARRFGASPGTVSEHLTALRAAGLVTGYRIGRAVRYQATELGQALVAATRTTVDQTE